jgi:hypothetical protein
MPFEHYAPQCDAFAQVAAFEKQPGGWRLTFGEVHHATPKLAAVEVVESALVPPPTFPGGSVFVCLKRVDSHWREVSRFAMDEGPRASCPRQAHEDVLTALTRVQSSTSTPPQRGEAVARIVNGDGRDVFYNIGKFWRVAGGIDAAPIARVLADRARAATRFDLGPEVIYAMVAGVGLDANQAPVIKLDPVVAEDLLIDLLNAHSAAVACSARMSLHLLAPEVDDGAPVAQTCTEVPLEAVVAQRVHARWQQHARSRVK